MSLGKRTHGIESGRGTLSLLCNGQAMFAFILQQPTPMTVFNLRFMCTYLKVYVCNQVIQMSWMSYCYTVIHITTTDLTLRLRLLFQATVYCACLTHAWATFHRVLLCRNERQETSKTILITVDKPSLRLTHSAARTPLSLPSAFSSTQSTTLAYIHSRTLSRRAPLTSTKLRTGSKCLSIWK